MRSTSYLMHQRFSYVYPAQIRDLRLGGTDVKVIARKPRKYF